VFSIGAMNLKMMMLYTLKKKKEKGKKEKGIILEKDSI